MSAIARVRPQRDEGSIHVDELTQPLAGNCLAEERQCSVRSTILD